MTRSYSLASASLAMFNHHRPFSVIVNSPRTRDSSSPSLTALRKWWDVSVSDSPISSARRVTLARTVEVSKRSSSARRTGDDMALNSFVIRTSSSQSGKLGSDFDCCWLIQRRPCPGITPFNSKTFCDFESKPLWIRRNYRKEKTLSCSWHDRASITFLRRLR